VLVRVCDEKGKKSCLERSLGQRGTFSAGGGGGSSQEDKEDRRVFLRVFCLFCQNLNLETLWAAQRGKKWGRISTVKNLSTPRRGGRRASTIGEAAFRKRRGEASLKGDWGLRRSDLDRGKKGAGGVKTGKEEETKEHGVVVILWFKTKRKLKKARRRVGKTIPPGIIVITKNIGNKMKGPAKAHCNFRSDRWGRGQENGRAELLKGYGFGGGAQKNVLLESLLRGGVLRKRSKRWWSRSEVRFRKTVE